MQIRYILRALVLGGAIAANPALARDDVHGNWGHYASQSATTGSRNGNQGNQQSIRQQSFTPSNRSFAPRPVSPNPQLPQWTQNNFRQNWNRSFNYGHAPNYTRGAGQNFTRNNWNKSPSNSWNPSGDRNRIRDWNSSHRGIAGPSRVARHRQEWNNFRFSSHSVARLNSSERNHWTHGHWHHGRHHHRYGWWWFVNGGWFFYDQPIYPYPGYVSYNAYYDGDYGDEDDYGYDGDSDDYYGDDAEGASADDGYRYFCRDPEGYYPDIRQCRTDWQRVSSSPYGEGYAGYGGTGPDEGGAPYDNGPENDRR